MPTQQITMRRLDSLREYDRNAKQHPDTQLKNLAESIRRFGFRNPVLIDREGVIVAGHGRCRAAKLLGLTEVPCLIADDMSEEDIRAYRVLDNKLAESPWDMELLAAELPELDLSGFELDFELPEIKAEPEITEDEAPEVDEEAEPVCKPGDIWQLGRHRLMCGNSTDRTALEKLLDGHHADLTLTDPPYGISIVNTHSKIGGGGPVHFERENRGGRIVPSTTYREVINDESTDTARASYDILKDLSENQIIFGGNYFSDFLPPSPCWIVWDKENGTNDFADAELAWTSFDKAVRLYRWLWNGLCRKGDHKTEGRKRVHPTQKPVGMLAEILKDFSEEDDLILDCFGGSGSTLIACEQLNRQCFMMELDPRYCDVIIARWENFTGEKAVKL